MPETITEMRARIQAERETRRATIGYNGGLSVDVTSDVEPTLDVVEDEPPATPTKSRQKA